MEVVSCRAGIVPVSDAVRQLPTPRSCQDFLEKFDRSLELGPATHVNFADDNEDRNL